MSKDNRRVITWSHIESSQNYRNSLSKYSHKIYSIGLHEFGVTAEGKIYNYNSEVNYFDSSGNHTGTHFPVINENDMVNYPSIQWYLQLVLFGWSKVKPFLDNVTVNSEGRLPQDQFIYELKKLIDLYQFHRTTGEPLNIAGIEMDVEASQTDDTVSMGQDVKYVQFLERVKNEVVIPAQLKMRVNVHAMWGNNLPFYYRFHNYKLFAESADMNGNATIDEIQLMTYDYAWNGSSAGASTPLWWFEDVAAWCKKNFDPKENPKAKLTIDNLYFGAAGYGHRWGMHNNEVVKRGSNITYHQLLGWSNGLYKHYNSETMDDGGTKYIYTNQEYLAMAAVQDDESKNEIMYPHVYDRFVPKYADVKTHNNGEKTATVGTYNLLDYAATNFKIQIPKWTGVQAIANRPSSFSGKAYPMVVPKSIRDEAADKGIDVGDLSDDKRQTWDTNLDPNSLDFQHIVKTVNSNDEVFVGWYTEALKWREVYEYNTDGSFKSASCVLEDKAEGQINYNVNIPSSGTYHLVAITSFSWYTQMKLGGTVNGQSFTVGGDSLPEWYPFVMKGSHFFDCGQFSFASGTNTISVKGELSAANTPIYGFVICSGFDANVSGGELGFKANIQPLVKRDGTNAAIPSKLALAAKMLRRDARPAILWDDEFRTYGNDIEISSTSYYRKANDEFRREGAGDVATDTGKTDSNKIPIYKCYSPTTAVGYTQGYWTQKQRSSGTRSLHFNSADENNVATSGQLVLSKQWTVNLSIEATLEVVQGDTVGIRFYAQKEGTVGDGYIFLINFKRGVRELILEQNINGTMVSKTIASQPIGNVEVGQRFIVKALLHNGVGQFFVGGVQAFIEGDGNAVTHDGTVDVGNGKVTLERRSGAVGIYANNCEMYCTHLGISTTDRWETLEKFEVTVDGNTTELGRINRTGYNYDEFGYLIYSGLTEKATRDSGEETSVSLDYEMDVIELDGFQGAKDITIKLRDAGVWFGELLVGDREGMSIIWAGDAWSFLEVMNRAVNDYGAKGIGLWAMGQEDPKVWELIPDVVPKTQ